MDTTQPGMSEIINAVGTLQAGDRQAARTELLRLWHEWSKRDAPLQRCTIAHFLADTEDDPATELEWDLLALEAATGSRGDSDLEAVDPSLNNFLPSLHLNVGDACRRTGQSERAKLHVENGLARSSSLEDDGYGQYVRGGLERLRARLDNNS